MSRQEDFDTQSDKYVEMRKSFSVNDPYAIKEIGEAHYQGAEYGYQYALQHPAWIPVKEEPYPPKKNKWDKKVEVLVYGLWMGRPTILFGTYHYDTNEWGANGLISDITHWMPLPTPPQRKEE